MLKVRQIMHSAFCSSISSPRLPLSLKHVQHFSVCHPSGPIMESMAQMGWNENHSPTLFQYLLTSTSRRRAALSAAWIQIKMSTMNWPGRASFIWNSGVSERAMIIWRRYAGRWQESFKVSFWLPFVLSNLSNWPNCANLYSHHRLKLISWIKWVRKVRPVSALRSPDLKAPVCHNSN